VDDLFDNQTVPEYNTRAVEKLTGIPADTFRAWERRYGLPAPARTEGNHRLYSQRDIAIVMSLKQLTEDGVSISRAVSIVQRRLTVEPSTADEPAAAPLNGSGFAQLQHRLIAAFTQFDASEANHVMEEALALYEPETVALDVIQPALIELGNAWERGDVCAAIGNFGTAFSMRKLSALFNASQPEMGSPTILMSCVAGEMHEVGLMITALVLSRSGYRVIYLGANMPGAELAEAVRRVQPDAVVLSAPTEIVTDALRESVASLHEDTGSDRAPVIGYGGAVFELSPKLRDTVDAVYLGRDARGARDILRQMLRSRAEGLVLTP
jgi:MerR family transcriptional regulator, light-induced transcriptional regulator